MKSRFFIGRHCLPPYVNSEANLVLTRRMIDKLRQKHPFTGNRMLRAMLKRESYRIAHKKPPTENNVSASYSNHAVSVFGGWDFMLRSNI